MPNDPKWRTIARASKQSISTVMAVYLHILVNASNADARGSLQGFCSEDVASALDIDCEQVDAIVNAMQNRVLNGESVTGWDKRQPSREREDNTNAERQRTFKAKQNQVTPSNATVTPGNAEKHLEEIRGDKKNTPPTPVGGVDEVDEQPEQPKPGQPENTKPEFTPGFAEFWKTWPTNDRKQAQGKCFESWKKANAERDAALVLSHVEHLKTCEMWTKQGGQFVPAPLVYLNKRAWEGVDDGAPKNTGVLAGAI